MGVLWVVVPIPFSDQDWAPLYVTLMFQLFLDPEADYAFSATVAVLGSAVVIAATLLLLGLNYTFNRYQLVARRRKSPLEARHDSVTPDPTQQNQTAQS